MNDIQKFDLKRCPDCGGKGKILHTTRDGAPGIYNPDCETCEGAGWLPAADPEPEARALDSDRTREIRQSLHIPPVPRRKSNPLFELCVICDGKGVSQDDALNTHLSDKRIVCVGCQGEKYLPYGLNHSQVRAMHHKTGKLEAAQAEIARLRMGIARLMTMAEKSRNFGPFAHRELNEAVSALLDGDRHD